jgi:hypothetical protein
MEIDVSALEPDLGAVDLLAGLQLLARRHGVRLRIRGASCELRDLVALSGLTEALESSMMDFDQEVNG